MFYDKYFFSGQGKGRDRIVPVDFAGYPTEEAAVSLLIKQ